MDLEECLDKCLKLQVHSLVVCMLMIFFAPRCSHASVASQLHIVSALLLHSTQNNPHTNTDTTSREAFKATDAPIICYQNSKITFDGTEGQQRVSSMRTTSNIQIQAVQVPAKISEHTRPSNVALQTQRTGLVCTGIRDP